MVTAPNYCRDTVGQELHSSRSITNNFYRGAKGILFVYDVTNQSSYDHICRWEEAIRTFTEGTGVQRILIGNKCDCDGLVRLVSTEDGQRLATSMNVPFFETSAKTGANVSESFETITRMIVAGSSLMKGVPQFESEVTHSSTRTCPC